MAVLVLLLCLFTAIYGFPANRNVPIQYIQFRGPLTNPAIQQVKSYCASRDYLPHKFLTTADVDQLPPIAYTLTVPETMEHYQEMKGRFLEEKNPLRRYKETAVSKTAWETSTGQQNWLNFDFSLSQEAKLFVKHGANAELDFVDFHGYDYGLLEGHLKELSMAIKGLGMKEDGNYYITGLEDLFERGRLSAGLYTQRIAEETKATRLSFPEKDSLEGVKVVSCAEKPEKERKWTSIVIAVQMRSFREL